MQRKVNFATKYFEQVWSQIFANQGARYTTPKIVSYTGSISTACGVLGSNNAFYCGADRKIYYDAVFFTGMMKAAGDYLGTDGDYAPIVILAHEWGHAVQAQLDAASFIGLFRENVADCLAGAITKQAAFDRYLDRGDLEEARYALILGGDAPGKTWIFDKNIPPDHLRAGLEQARQIVPLDAEGRPSPNGKSALMSIGMSNMTMESQTFMKPPRTRN